MNIIISTDLFFKKNLKLKKSNKLNTIFMKNFTFENFAKKKVQNILYNKLISFDDYIEAFNEILSFYLNIDSIELETDSKNLDEIHEKLIFKYRALSYFTPIYEFFIGVNTDLNIILQDYLEILIN